jgi:3-carboxy-cis,cis-muconate cycloisomerase
MPATVFDSDMFRDTFGSADMRAIFDDRALVARYVEVELALARVQGELGIIPLAAAQTIAERCDAAAIDLAVLKAETDLVGYPVVGVVNAMKAQCGEVGAHYIHWGATTQDIMDTATVLQVRAGLDLIDAELAICIARLVALTDTHRATVMAGRTHLQHALPVTFGLKTAVWLAMLERHRMRLAQARPRAQVLQFAGAAGTLASLGRDGLKVHAALAKTLDLAPSDLPWHVARDGFVEVVSLLAGIAASLHKLALDITLLMQTEVGEVNEPYVEGRGSSSTMPHKRNPIASEFIMAMARSVRQDVALMLDSAAGSDHERATGPWQLEWMALPRAFIATGGALQQTAFLLGGLVVDPQRMRRNLDVTGGLIVSEAVMMALAPRLGRDAAKKLVGAACTRALAKQTMLLDELVAEPKITAVLDRGGLARLCDPAAYLGVTDQMITRVLRRHRRPPAKAKRRTPRS